MDDIIQSQESEPYTPGNEAETAVGDGINAALGCRGWPGFTSNLRRIMGAIAILESGRTQELSPRFIATAKACIPNLDSNTAHRTGIVAGIVRDTENNIVRLRELLESIEQTLE